ncbi:MAG TPA: SMC-Scp complex subunit ScpB [Candidatus Nanoarchaeia archaeon]|nr:SMC-Scp complex subunit ScpB [Candidatus Nanoarchaeia archaeon]
MHLSKESIDEIDKGIEEENIKKVEAALFIAGKFMSIQELVAFTDVNPIILKKILEDLSEAYKDSGIEIVNKNNLWKMDVSPNYTWMVNKLAGGNSEFTRAEQETLALIAYKQPMKQSIVIKIRGNKAYDHIRSFVERGLINKKRMGHTSELTLNDNFFDYFSLTGNSENNSFEIVEKFESGVSEVKEQNSGAEQGKASG